MITGKVFEVLPGTVYQGDTGFSYTVRVRSSKGMDTHTFCEGYKSPNEAKQKMREKVAYLKRKHCV